MTPCHENGRGCIRAFEDDTCGEQGQCSIVLAVLAERERCAKIAEDEDGELPGWGEHRNMVTAQRAGKDIAAAIRKGSS